jgi:hypothetical protein
MTLNVFKIPGWILRDLRERDLSDEQIVALTPREAFREYCEWNGLIGWSETLLDAASALDEAEEE